jgi:UDP-N-acetylmuramate dehydrogenase
MAQIEDKIRAGVPLAPLTTLGVGGAARFFLDAEDETSVADALAWASSRGVSVTVLGGGSNVIVSDRGVDGLVIRVRVLGIDERQSGDQIELGVGAGEVLDEVVARAVASGWAGIECLSGVPGSVGATPIQNVGAYGQEIGDVVTSVTAIDRATLDITKIDKAACLFAYRTSVFKRGLRDRYVVLRVELALRAGGSAAVRYADLAGVLGAGSTQSLPAVRDAVLGLRRKKSMLVDPADPNHKSVGSFFVNPVVGADRADEIERLAARTPPDPAPMPRFGASWGCVKLSAAWLIERAGFSKGAGDGNVGISSKHALAIVNRGGASATEIVDFARRVRDTVKDRFGVTLDAEPVLVGFDGGETLLRG